MESVWTFSTSPVRRWRFVGVFVNKSDDVLKFPKQFGLLLARLLVLFSALHLPHGWDLRKRLFFLMTTLGILCLRPCIARTIFDLEDYTPLPGSRCLCLTIVSLWIFLVNSLASRWILSAKFFSQLQSPLSSSK